MTAELTIERQPFGTLSDGRPAELFTLRNAKGSSVKITNFGGTITSIVVGDRSGRYADVTLGFDKLAPYLENKPFFGSIIGRFGNRIAGAAYELDGQSFGLTPNDGPNSLHGGPGGFHKKLWSARELMLDGQVALELTTISPDGEEGLGGNLAVHVTYSLSCENELRIDYRATCDKSTVINLTNHAYFNLKGPAAGGPGGIVDHKLTLAADAFTPTDAASIPTGEIRPVEGTVMDFRTPRPIGPRINDPDEQLVFGKGYDHNWIVRGGGQGELVLAARLEEPVSGRVMEVLTTEPGIQFYSGNFLEGVRGKGGQVYHSRDGLCLETQHYPDSPHHPHFPSTVLRPGQEYRSTTVYKFATV